MKKIVRIIFIAFILFLIIAAIIIGINFLPVLSRGWTEESEAYTVLRLIYEGDLQDQDSVEIIDSQVHLSYDFIKEKIDPNVYFDQDENTLIFTNEENVRRYKVDELEGTVNDVLVNLRTPVTFSNDKLMVPIEAFVYDYPIDVRYVENDNLVLIDRTDRNYIFGEITDDVVWIREENSKDSPIVRTLNTGDEVIVYEETDEWVKVRQVNGRAGWTQKENVQFENVFKDLEKYRENSLKNQEEEEISENQEEINLAWDYTAIQRTGSEGLENHLGVNIMSPTWFSLNEDKTISDRSNPDYVNFYTSQNVEVWPMFDNNYNGELTYEILKSSSSRQKVIENIANLFRDKGYSGINLDFESLDTNTRDYYTQFVRELYPIFNEMGIKVSVDVVPKIHAEVEKEPYDRKALAEVADYVILMAYDQHWGSSPTAGSVAEYSWVESNMNILFREIPMDKFILAMPTYTRIWSNDGQNVTSQSVGMETANQYIANNDMTIEWDDRAKQYVSFKDMGDEKVSIWLEDSRSIREKTSLATKYDLAGVASWRVGFETEDIWPTIDNNLE